MRRSRRYRRHGCSISVYVPADTMIRAFDRGFVLWMVTAALALLWFSRRFFRRALQAYRSASS